MGIGLRLQYTVSTDNISYSRRIHGQSMQHALSYNNAYKISLENLKGRDHSEVLLIDGRIILERILKKQGGKMCNEFIWVRTVSNGWLL
jgi:hypothetical protein